MSSHEAYLRNALSKYRYADIAKRDILNAFQTFTDLRPNLDFFVYNNGSRTELLCLDGTIPVGYKGSRYNIPVCLWLTETHPHNPPMVYVKPTSTMQIKPGKHVDSNGKIYLPYLHEWKHPQSDLYGLIQVLVIIFSEEPPVFARRTPMTGPTPAQPPRPYPNPQATPPYPPPAGSNMPMPSVQGSSYPAASSASNYPPSSYPGYPSYPSATGYPQQQPAQQSQPSYPGYPGYPSTQTSTVQSQNSISSLSDEQIRASLLSAVEDKMRRRLKEIFAQAQAELSTLNKTQEDLQKGKKTLEDMLQKLERESSEIEQNIAILGQKDEEIQQLLEKMDGQEQVEIDDAVVPTAPLYKQLLNIFAEEQATEDAIYYLAEGLKRGAIDLEVYLKQVRELSRKQFMLRALIQRCRQKAGLPEVSSG